MESLVGTGTETEVDVDATVVEFEVWKPSSLQDTRYPASPLPPLSGRSTEGHHMITSCSPRGCCGTFCAAHGLVYQGFSLLTANRDALAHPELSRIAQRHGRTAAQVVFRFALEVGMVPLTGTTSAGHMSEDLEVFDFQLEPAEVECIEGLAAKPGVQ